MTTSSRICQQCGEVLPSEEAVCDNCGVPYIEPTTVEPARLTSSTGADFDAGQTAEPPPPSAVPPLPREIASYSNPTYGSQEPGDTFPPPFSPPSANQSKSMSDYRLSSGQALGTGQISARKARKWPKVTAILGVVFLLLLLTGGFFFVTKTINGQSAILPNSTSPVDLPTQIASQPASQALFSDDFSNNDNAWDTTSGSGYTRNISNNELTLADSNHKILIETLPTNNTFADLMFTMTFTLVQADQNDSVGLYVRGDSNLDHDYRIDIFGDDSYAISKEYLSGTSVKIKSIVDPTHTSELNPVGQQNTVTFIVKDATLILVINNKIVSTVSDSDYTNGQTAIFVQNGDSSKGVKAMFSNVTIYPAPQHLPG